MVSDSGPGKPNVFQRAMLQWNDLHPYHAVHVLRFQGTPELNRLRRIIAHRLGIQGLTSLRIDRTAGTFHYDGDPLPVEIQEVAAEADPARSLNSEIERQLNLRFDVSSRFLPFRFFVLTEEGSFLLGATYFHPIADAESVALLLRDVATDYITGRSVDASRTLELHPPRHDRLTASWSKVTAHKLLALPSEIQARRQSYRTPLRDAHDLGNRTRLTQWPAETLQRLTRTARSWGVTVHDLLLTMSLRALAPLAPGRHRERRRRNITLGTIVNIRRDHGIDSEHTFGLFLGSFAVSHSVPEGITLKQLAGEVHRQTSKIKRSRRYLATPLELRLACRLVALCSTLRQKKFYHKNHPLWGGITNMNMNKLWPDEHLRPMDYFRAVSTGPAVPLVWSVTTFGNRMHIGLTYRPAVFTSEDIDILQAELRRQLTDLEACS